MEFCLFSFDMHKARHNVFIISTFDCGLLRTLFNAKSMQVLGMNSE